MISFVSFGGADSGMNPDVMVSFLLDVGRFVERLCLFLYCLYITPRGGGHILCMISMVAIFALMFKLHTDHNDTKIRKCGGL
jgi:hypothetical protein